MGTEKKKKNETTFAVTTISNPNFQAIVSDVATLVVNVGAKFLAPKKESFVNVTLSKE